MDGKKCVFDIETDGLLDTCTCIHCISIIDVETGEATVYDPPDKEKGLEHLLTFDTIIGHNIIGFDIPAIKLLYPEIGKRLEKKKLRDTLVWARVVYPDIKNMFDWALWRKKILPPKLIGSHSLKAYGYRLGEYKGEFGETTDWSEWSPEMSQYCKQDTVVTYKLYRKLVAKSFPEQCIEDEHRVAQIIKRQEDFGFKFKTEEAALIYADIRERMRVLKRELGEEFKPWYEPVKLFTPKRDNRTRGYKKGAMFTKIKRVNFNPGSTKNIATALTRYYGWKPTDFTDKGEPQCGESILKTLPYPHVDKIITYQILKKFAGMLGNGKNSWLKLVDTDDRLRGRVLTNGAVSGRMTHIKPNIAQTPSISKDKEGNIKLDVAGHFGYESRQLFTVDKGYKLVGADASGLELRMLAHFTGKWDGGMYANEILKGDIHTKNQKAAGLPTRDLAKTFIYALLYGGGDEKIGSIVGKGRGAGKALKRKFYAELPAMKKLDIIVKNKAQKFKYIKGLDGRRVPIRKHHAALNTLLQGAGALVMKKALIILDDSLQAKFKAGVDFEFVANIHDEFQIQVKEEYAEEVGRMAVEAIKKAGEYYNMRCPLDGEYKVGDTWADTH